MKKIIACTDFSANAKSAVEYAFEVAQHYNASLTILHSYLIPIPVSEVPPSQEIFEITRKEAEEQMKSLVEQLQNRNKNKIEIVPRIENENLIISLEELIKEAIPDLIVIGTRGERDVIDVVVGSNTLKVLNHFTLPVLVVPLNAHFKPLSKIGFACDFSKVVQTTPVDLIRKLVTDFKAELHVLNADYRNKHFNVNTPEESMLLDHLLFKLKPHYHFLEGKETDLLIEEYAEKNNLDLLITIPKNHGFFERFFKGTNTRRFIYHTHTPLLCVHEK